MIDRAYVLTLNAQHPQPDVFAAKMNAAMTDHHITTPRAQAMFVSQIMVESGGVPQQENLNYSAARLMQVWPARFPTIQNAQIYAYQPELLANRVYAGRMGNTHPGDGWTYRGRGLIQLTGLDNYALYDRLANFRILTQPDLLLEYGVSVEVAGAFWEFHALSAAAEAGDVKRVTLAINGGLTGLDERERLYQRAVHLRAGLGLLSAETLLDPVADAAADAAHRDDMFAQALALTA